MSNGAAWMHVRPALRASARGAFGTVQWIRDAVVAITVRVGVRNGHRVEDVLSAPGRLCGAAASVLRTLAGSSHLTGNPAIGVSSLLGETMSLAGSEGLIVSAFGARPRASTAQRRSPRGRPRHPTLTGASCTLALRAAFGSASAGQKTARRGWQDATTID